MNRAPAPRVELLAPAGGWDALVAAVNNGADAVYCGLAELNARRGAENFDLQTLARATRFAHLRDVKVYLTANVVVLPNEIPSALEMIDAAWSAGVDAVIIQDLGLMHLVRTSLPDVRIHASTQVDAMNPPAVELLAGSGAARVTLARELDLRQIRACAATGVEVETFVHGALCYCYSGQCLMSSMIGRRSANRGLCAQPCRLPYALIGPDGRAVGVPGPYLLSPKDFAGIAHLPALIDAGVVALKIEGRMKAPEYVAIVTSVYRAALDRALADPEGFEVLPSEWELLEEAFNRGFTDAYLTHERGSSLMSYARPNNRGVFVGRVVAPPEGTTARVALERALDAADTVEFWTNTGRFAQQAGPMVVDGRSVRTAPAGSVAMLEVERSVTPGDRVFRVMNAALIAAARRTFGEQALDRRPTPIEFAVTIRIGSPVTVRATAAGQVVEVRGGVVEPARTKPVSAEEVVRHVGRLGGSGYDAAGWQVDLDADAGIGFSELHHLRREALERLDELRLAAWGGRRRRSPVAPVLPSRPRTREAPLLVASVWDLETARACLASGADEVLFRVFSAPKDPLPAGVRPLLPRVVWEDEREALEGWLDGGVVAVGNLGMVASAARRGAVAADWPLNVVNEHAAAALREAGVTFAWASPELSERQMAHLAAHAPIPVGCTVWGRLELMVTEQCVLQAAGKCNRRCAACSRRRSWWRLKDRKGYEFPVITDVAGRSHVVNSVTLDLTRSLDAVVATGVEALRAEFTTEDARRAAEVVRGLRAALDAVLAGRSLPTRPLEEPATTGHFFRGVR